MRLTIYLDLSGPAFHSKPGDPDPDYTRDAETAAILRNLANALEAGKIATTGNLPNTQFQPCGRWEYHQ